MCGRGDIYRIWPCCDLEGDVDVTAWPKLGKPCNHSKCRHYKRLFLVEARIKSNKKIIDYTK